MDFVCTQDFFKPKSCETYSYHWSTGKSNLVATCDCEVSTFTFFCLEDETKYNAFGELAFGFLIGILVGYPSSCAC